jgi:carboxypeptidase Taq
VHWSSLAVGYFPTYLLGALMAAQLDHHLRNDPAFAKTHGPVDALVAAGDFAPLRAWLGTKVHARGRVPQSMDALLVEATGEPLRTDYFLAYLQTKYEGLYGLRK